MGIGADSDSETSKIGEQHAEFRVLKAPKS